MRRASDLNWDELAEAGRSAARDAIAKCVARQGKPPKSGQGVIERAKGLGDRLRLAPGGVLKVVLRSK